MVVTRDAAQVHDEDQPQSRYGDIIDIFNIMKFDVASRLPAEYPDLRKQLANAT